MTVSFLSQSLKGYVIDSRNLMSKPLSQTSERKLHLNLSDYTWMGFIGFAIGFVMGASIHESGHAIVALSYGRHIEELRIGPCLQIYPKLKLVTINRDFGEVQHDPPQSRLEEGLREIAGSGSTAIVAFLGMILLRRLHLTRRKSFTACVVNIVLAWDIISYSIFPRIGLRHWIFVGGADTEPLRGVILLGIPEFAYYVSLAAYAGVIHWLAFVQLQHIVKPALHELRHNENG